MRSPTGDSEAEGIVPDHTDEKIGTDLGSGKPCSTCVTQFPIEFMHIDKGNGCEDDLGEAAEQQCAYVEAAAWEIRRGKVVRIEQLLLAPSVFEYVKPGLVETDVQ